MARFWLATCEIGQPAASADPAAEPILAAGSRTLAIEVIHDEASGELAVLFSTVDDKDKPEHLTCRIGFANGAKSCSVWRDRGFPLVDAQIQFKDTTLRVGTSYFARKESAMQYESHLLSITGIEFAQASAAAASLRTCYEQAQQAPDSGLPATWIRRRAVHWNPGRANVKKRQSPTITMNVTQSRYPSLMPFTTGDLTLSNVWSGGLDLPPAAHFPSKATDRASRADTFGVPAFRFADVEVLGFRIDLDGTRPGIDEKLARLIEPLNFHLRPADDGADRSSQNAVTDFRFRAATRTVVIELLRYPSMKLRRPSAPLQFDDYQSQHELVVRVLVGRVDDDTAQANSPAIFVPAIFVDNSWSKAVGRDVQGFDKRMANFCVARPGNAFVRLRPDGRVAERSKAAGANLDDDPEALAHISRIDLVENTGSQDGVTILDLHCAPETHENWDAFEKIDLELALGSSSLAPTRWRQSDFDVPEFRRSFARAAVRETLKGFHSIQVTPVGDRKLDPAWITGTFTVDGDLRIARPAGVASITLHRASAAPSGWNLLCDMLGIAEGRFKTQSFPTGSWYRLKFSMDLTIDNGLDWTGTPV